MTVALDMEEMGVTVEMDGGADSWDSRFLELLWTGLEKTLFANQMALPITITTYSRSLARLVLSVMTMESGYRATDSTAVRMWFKIFDEFRSEWETGNAITTEP